VLALAAVFNDLKDIGYGIEILSGQRPAGDSNVSRLWGNYCGVEMHLYRNLFGTLHEAFKIIQKNRIVLDDEYYSEIVRVMSRPGRSHWATFIEVALGAEPSDAFGRCLHRARNKVAYHYDPKAILQGYRSHFKGGARQGSRAFISRGNNMRSTRFYFADAALQGYMENVAHVGEVDELLRDTFEAFDHLNQAISEFVELFVQKRAGSFRVEREDNT